jgi:glycosyltransferase 2 family protein
VRAIVPGVSPDSEPLAEAPVDGEPQRSRRVGGESRLRAVVGLLVSVVAIGGVAWWASTQPAPRFPSAPGDLALVGVAVLVYAAATVLRGWRWDHVLETMDIKHARSDSYGLTTVGYMGNTVLPARGGEVLRIFLMAERSHARRREILGSIVTERLLDVAALVVLFSAITLFGVDGAPGGAWAGAAAAVGVVGAAVAVFAYDRARKAGRLEAFAERVRPVARASKVLLTRAGVALAAVTLAVWCAEGLILYLVTQALDVPIGIAEGMAVVVLASLSALIPAGPGYVGTYDAAALFALHRIGVQGGEAVSAVVLFRFVVFVPLTAVGLLVMVTRYGGLRAALRREHAAEDREPAPGAPAPASTVVGD